MAGLVSRWGTETAAAAPKLSDQPTVTTIAGSGLLGYADGPGAEASFIAPIGLHFAPDGTLYIADRGAQRIRRVSSNGFVTTVAGSGRMVALGIGVAGGYADGSALSARFNDPEDVAVLPNGTIIVADTLNNCLRSIVGNVVATYAGRCGQAGNASGSLHTSRFGRPRSLAVDSQTGDLFVVDPPNGIRRIENGIVSDFKSSHSIDSTAIAEVNAPTPTLIISSLNQIDAVKLTDGSVLSELPLTTSYISGAQRVGVMPAGPATGIAAFAADDFVYADPLNSAVMLAQNGYHDGGSYLRILGATPPLTAPVAGFSYNDGADGRATFDQPTSVAVAPDGRIAVADLGNRRIRILSPFDHDTYVTRIDRNAELPETPDSSVIRVAIVGSSYVDMLQGTDDSLAGEVAKDVNAHRGPGRKRIAVYPVMKVGASIPSILSLVNADFGDGGFDVVIVDIPDRGQFPIPGVSDATTESPDALFPLNWPQMARAELAATQLQLAKNGTKLVVLIHPGMSDFLDESAYFRIEKGNPYQNQLTTPLKDPATIQGYRTDVLAAVTGSGVPVIDSWLTMLSDHATANRRSLFFAWDHHFAPHAREIIANDIATYLLRTLNT